MANSKISALPAASTPLAGTEVLPVVQGGITEQVSVANLTAGRVVSASGLLVDANSATAAVRITQLGAGNALLVEDSANPDATPFVIDATGKVVIGYTSAPTISGVPQLQLANSATAAGSQLGVSNWIANTSGAGIQLAKSRSGTVGTQGIVSSGDTIGQIQFFGDDGTTFISAASIVAAVDGTPGTNDMPGRLVFSTTADGASSPTERMRINSAGNVGIGSTYGLTRLDVATAVSAGAVTDVALFTQATQSNPTTGQGVRIYFAASASISRAAAIEAAVSNGLNGHHLAFLTNIAGASPTEKLRVDATGNVLVTSTGGLGYGTGSGGAVTQATSRTTGVTLNKTNGAITLFTAAGSITATTFTVTNSTVAATDVVNVCQKSGTNLYNTLVTAVAAGSFNITFFTTGGVASDAPVFNFAVTKAVTA